MTGTRGAAYGLALGAWAAGMEAATWAGLVPAIALCRRRDVARPRELGERLGRSLPSVAAGRKPWLVHAVSAGEMSAASAIVAEMGRRAVGLRAFLTTGTEAGRRIADALAGAYPDVVAGVAYLPWDRPAAMRRWLAALGPEAAVVIEAELWPGLFDAARRASVPIAVASGRLTDAEAQRYRLVRPLFRGILSAPAWIGVQTPGDAGRFVAAGAEAARVEVAGNLKWDAPARGRALPAEWEACLGGPLVAGASTHAPEEELLFDALASIRGNVRDVRLVLAPRHVGRALAVAASARAHGLRASLLSAPPARGWDVLVVDGYGFLPSIYGKAAVVFVGGSLAPRRGHSPIEPALSGVPLVMGPHDDSCEEASRALEDAGALARVSPLAAAPSLASAVANFLRSPHAARRASAASRAVADRERGAAARAVDRILALVGS
ncbi:MAG TPA: glycosyltransferase N-terminal domain-containing protein [Thermoanaerobaculia bacterium]|nr:glycosyltransferase N-terminal domain-containing protein [Thermoanaerobaculia bacterium]